MKKPLIRILQLSAFVVPILTIAALSRKFVKRMYDGTAITRQVKLFDCTNRTLHTSFPVPKGDAFNLVLGGAHRFGGTIAVRQSTNAAQEIRFSDRTAPDCNWLDRHGYANAGILTWSTENSLQLRAGEAADITVEFVEMPPTNSSVWICFVQSFGALEQERREREK